MWRAASRGRVADGSLGGLPDGGARSTGPADVYLSVALACSADIVDEHLQRDPRRRELEMHDIRDDHGIRLHGATASTPASWRSSTAPRPPAGPSRRPSPTIDPVRYLRPSRYCESDRLSAFADAEFGGLEGQRLLEAVSSWVGMQVAYVAGSSRPTDGAVDTLLSRQGVCRDFAHLVDRHAAGLRRAGPAGLGLRARACSRWTSMRSPRRSSTAAGRRRRDLLAPRQPLLRIATGRDAADTAFLTSFGEAVTCTSLEVTAVADDGLPDDDVSCPTQLG